MKPQYERISWGWCAYVADDELDELCRGRGETKADALEALKAVIKEKKKNLIK